MDARQLKRWLTELSRVIPAKVEPIPGDSEDLDVILQVLLQKNTNRIEDKYVIQHSTKLWARCSRDQWEELRYLAEQYQVPWPVRHLGDLERLMAGLDSEYPADGGDECELPL